MSKDNVSICAKLTLEFGLYSYLYYVYTQSENKNLEGYTRIEQ